MRQTTNGEIFEAISDLREELLALRRDNAKEIEKLRAEIKPVADAYAAGTTGAKVLKWVVSVLAGISVIFAAIFPWKTGR